MKLIVKKPFSWAHKGVSIEAFEVGQVIETEDQDLIDVSTKEGWASKGKGAAKPTADQGAASNDKAADAAGDADASTAPDAPAP